MGEPRTCFRNPQQVYARRLLSGTEKPKHKVFGRDVPRRSGRLCGRTLRPKNFPPSLGAQENRVFCADVHHRSGESPAFGKPWVCLSDTRHFRHSRRFRGSDEQKPCFEMCRMQTRHFRRLSQNPLFSAGDKTTVSQNHRSNNPDMTRRRGRP